MLDQIQSANQRPVLGTFGFVTGAIALVLVLVHFWAGPFAPQQPVGVSLGEIAGDMAKSAARKIAGLEQPAPIAPAWDIDRYIGLTTAVLAGLAGVFGVAGLVCQEKWRPSTGALVLGTTALVFQLFTWMILMVVGALLIVALIDRFSFTGLLGFGE